MSTPVGWAGLAVSLLLVAVAAGISWWPRLGLQRQILIAAARHLAAQGITIIWVTHDNAQARRIADQVYQLRDGHLTGIPAERVSP